MKPDEQFFRPAEVDLLMGDASKARRELGWEPRHSFQDLIDEMVQADLDGLNSTKLKADSAADGSS